MKLMMFEKGKGTALGLVDGKSVIDLSVTDASLPKDLKSLIAAPQSAIAAVKTAASTAPASARLALDAVKPALPISPSGKIICVGLNYALHAKEGGHAIPTYPSFSPQGGLDRIYHRGPLRLVSVHTCRLQIARVASDHLPVLAEFQVG